MSEGEWVRMLSTDDLRWHLAANAMEMPELERVRDDVAECAAARAAADLLIAERVRACSNIVAELQRRGERVEWEG